MNGAHLSLIVGLILILYFGPKLVASAATKNYLPRYKAGYAYAKASLIVHKETPRSLVARHGVLDRKDPYDRGISDCIKNLTMLETIEDDRFDD